MQLLRCGRRARKYGTGYRGAHTAQRPQVLRPAQRNATMSFISSAERCSRLFSGLPGFDSAKHAAGAYRLIDYDTRDLLRAPAQRRDHSGDRCAGLRPGRRGLRCHAADGRLSQGLAALHQLQLHRAAVHRLRPGAGDGRRDHRCLRQLRRLPGLRHRRADHYRARQCPGPAGADYQDAANWSSTATSARPSCTAPRAARSMSWAMPPGGRSSTRWADPGWSSTAPAWTSWPSPSWPAMFSTAAVLSS